MNHIMNGKLDYGLKAKSRCTFGPLNKLLLHTATGIPVDVFSAIPRNCGMALMVRTGHRERNVQMIYRFRALAMRGHAYGGVTGSKGRESPWRAPG